MSTFEPVVVISILKNAPSQAANRKGFETGWESAVGDNIYYVVTTTHIQDRLKSGWTHGRGIGRHSTPLMPSFNGRRT